MKSFAILPLYLILCCASSADIVPVPGTQSVGNLFSASDVVCNCSVQSISVTHEETVQAGRGQLVRKHETAVVRVQELYKGDPAAGSLLNVDFETEAPTTRASLPSLSDSEVALLFLKKAASGYEFADPFLGATRFDKIPIANGGDGIFKLQSALTSIIRAGDRRSSLKAATLLQGMDVFNQDTTGEMYELSHSNDPDLALSALAVLIKADPAEGTGRLETFLAGYSGDDQHIALQTISVELGRILDKRALPALESLSSSKFISIRFGSVLALRAMKAPQSVAALTRRLDDSDTDIQSMAVMALSEIYRKEGDYAPSSPLFDSNPQHYTDLWKSWLRDSATNAPMLAPE